MVASSFELYFARLFFTTSQRLRTWEMISVMLTNRIGIDKILEELYDRASDNGKKPKDSMAIVYAEWRQSVLNGSKLAEAVQGWVPESERMVIAAGEESGQLVSTLETLVDIVDVNQTIVSTVRNGLFYPVVLIGASMGYLFLFGLLVIPQFARVVDPTNWGSLAKSLHSMSIFVTNYGVPLIILMAVSVVAIIYSLPRLVGSPRIFLDRLPPWSLYRLVVGSSFMFSLAAMLNGGARITDALYTLSGSARPYLKERIFAFLLGINSGHNPGDAMKASGYKFPSKDIVADLGVYAQHSGDFGDALTRVTRRWMKKGVEDVKVQMKVLTGMSIAVIALLLIWITLGFFAIQQEIASLSRAGGM